MRIVVPVILILILTAGTADAQRLSPGPQDLSFFSAVDDTDQPYSVYIPDNFDESKHYPSGGVPSRCLVKPPSGDETALRCGQQPGI